MGSKKIVKHIEKMQWWKEVAAGRKIPQDSSVYHFNPIGFIEHVNMLASPLTSEERLAIMMKVSRFEGGFDACNKDTEFRVPGLVSYTGKAHIGLSWGFIQFTQDSGNLGKVLKRMDDLHHDLFVSTFGSNWQELIQVTNKPGISALDSWSRGTMLPDARSVRVQPIAIEKTGLSSFIKKELWEGEWLTRFQKAGKIKEFQDVQRTMAVEMFLTPALAVCRKMNIRSAKGIAIAFDRQVNKGRAAKIFKSVTHGSDSFAPLSEYQFLEKIRALYPVTNFQHGRIDGILKADDLNETNYDIETY